MNDQLFGDLVIAAQNAVAWWPGGMGDLAYRNLRLAVRAIEIAQVTTEEPATQIRADRDRYLAQLNECWAAVRSIGRDEDAPYGTPDTIAEQVRWAVAYLRGDTRLSDPTCEGCEEPAVTSDIEGVQLCKECAAEAPLANEAEPVCENCNHAVGNSGVYGAWRCVACAETIARWSPPEGARPAGFIFLLNGKPRQTPHNRLTYEMIAEMAGRGSSPTITYYRNQAERDGHVLRGGSIQVDSLLVINAYDTSNA